MLTIIKIESLARFESFEVHHLWQASSLEVSSVCQSQNCESHFTLAIQQCHNMANSRSAYNAAIVGLFGFLLYLIITVCWMLLRNFLLFVLVFR